MADGTIRIQTITPDADGPHTFTYTFGEGITPVVTDNGRVDLVRAIDGSPNRQIVGVLDLPWAVGADGLPVSTAYHVVGDTLEQTLQPSGATAYPIVADPCVGVGVGVYLYLDKAEPQATARVVQTIGVIGAGATCAVYAKRISVPGVKTLVNHLCGYVSAGAI